MEHSTKKIETTLSELLRLIQLTEMNSVDFIWFKMLRYELKRVASNDDIELIKKEILSCFAGMGSLSDYWLEKDGSDLPVNRRFQELLDELCILCRE